ncbi:MAG: RNA-guided endonuclease InsQ/TnpB family protein [Petrotogales bacterium]
MILTFKVKHHRDFSHELQLARKVAKFALKTGSRSSKDVKHIGLKSMIANQILRKYSKDKKLKKVRNVVLTIPNQGIHVVKDNRQIRIPSLKLELEYQFPNNFKRINQIEINKEFVFVSVTVDEPSTRKVDGYIGVDRNTTGHIAVAGNPSTGKVLKLGKQAEHIHKKYKNIRRSLQKKGKYGMVKKIKNRESNIVRDLNHKISRKIVDTADREDVGIKLEAIEQIRKNVKSRRGFRYSLNSWSYYQLEQMIKYKAKLLGIPVSYVEPAYTSQNCSRCGHLGNRNGKQFKCPYCGHVDHADSNASFNIALRHVKDGQLNVDRDAFKGSTDMPQEAML